MPGFALFVDDELSARGAGHLNTMRLRFENIRVIPVGNEGRLNGDLAILNVLDVDRWIARTSDRRAGDLAARLMAGNAVQYGTDHHTGNVGLSLALWRESEFNPTTLLRRPHDGPY